MIDRNSIIFGDCLEVMKNIEDHSIDMVLCDLPYGTTACKWDTIIPFDLLWIQYNRIVKPNGAIVLTASQPFTTILIASNIQNFKYEWIWIKSRATGFLQSKYMPMKTHESVLVFCNESVPTFNPQKTRGHKPTNAAQGYGHSPTFGKSKKRNYKGGDTERMPKSILDFKSERGLHPTQKPETLFGYMIKTYTNEGDLVLDNCCGSGTTGAAAKKLNRDYILIENDPEHYQTAKNRVQSDQIEIF